MTDRPERIGRRQLLSMIGVAGIGMLAGCSEEGTGGDDGGDNTQDPGDDSGSDSGDEGGDGTGDGGDDTGDETDDTDGDQDGTGDEEDDTGDNEDGDGEDGDGNGGDPDNPRLRDTLTLESSYKMEFEGEEGTGTWVFHEGDWRLSGTFDGEQTELYRITTDEGADMYTVADGRCIKVQTEVPDDEFFDPEDPKEDDEEYVANGTTTIDGQEVYVFEIEDGSYYVSVDTGHPVRFESPEGDVVNFSSWGDTDPISPPDMECTEPGR